MTAKSELATVHNVTDLTGPLVGMVLDAVDSPHTRRAYGRALSDFLTWYAAGDRGKLSKATVQRYAAELRAEGRSAADVNLRLSAIRRFAAEAGDNGMLSSTAANGIRAVKGVRAEGVRSGNWLTRDQAQRLLNAPDVTSLKGLRDRAILALLLGCGLRRSELSGLTFDHVQQREGRWVLVDVVGKRNKVRSIPAPSWAIAAVDAWAAAAGISTGRVFRRVHKGRRLDGDSMSAQAVADVVKEYAPAAGVPALAAHDCRRTFAKLALKGGSGLDQISLSLGHSSMEVTQRYLGVALDLVSAPCDRLGLSLNGD